MNTSATTSTVIDNDDESLCDTFQVLWLSGITTSILCLLIQISTFILIRSSRKTDEKTLALITVARILATGCEYYVMYEQTQKRPRLEVDFVYGLYFTSDFAIVLWMFVFTKHLYDKIVNVFNTTLPNLIIETAAVWIISLPFGFVSIYLLKYHVNLFIVFSERIYVVLKFVIVTFNSLIYIKIFYVAFKRGQGHSKKVRNKLKIAFVAFLLITTTCIQILATDIIAIINETESYVPLVKSFCVVNSFHVVPLTIMFIVILKGKMRQSITQTVRVRLKELVT